MRSHGRSLPKEGLRDIPRDYGGEEPEQVFRPETVQEMAVSAHFPTGVEGGPRSAGRRAYAQAIYRRAVLRGCFWHLHPLYASLYSRGLVNNNFSYGYEAYPGCAMLTVGGESRDPWALREAIAAEAARIGREGSAKSCGTA